MAEDPISAVTEAEATGETAAIFTDIKAAYRVGAVNLIWRHLATIPDCLPWAWRAIRPLYVDGTIARETVAFRASLRLPVLAPVPPEVFASLGLSADDVARIRGVLAAYDRTNSMALIALTAVAVLGNSLPLREGGGNGSDRAAGTHRVDVVTVCHASRARSGSTSSRRATAPRPKPGLNAFIIHSVISKCAY